MAAQPLRFGKTSSGEGGMRSRLMSVNRARLEELAKQDGVQVYEYEQLAPAAPLMPMRELRPLLTAARERYKQLLREARGSGQTSEPLLLPEAQLATAIERYRALVAEFLTSNPTAPERYRATAGEGSAIQSAQTRGDEALRAQLLHEQPRLRDLILTRKAIFDELTNRNTGLPTVNAVWRMIQLQEEREACTLGEVEAEAEFGKLMKETTGFDPASAATATAPPR